MGSSFILFLNLVGDLLIDVYSFHNRVVTFNIDHEIRTKHTNNELFKNSVTNWHYHFSQLLVSKCL